MLIYSFTFSQEVTLVGNWILKKIAYTNGNDLEVNHPYYSVINAQNITREMIIGNQIKLGITTYNYVFLNDELVLTLPEDNLKYTYIKEKDFLEQNPEFYPEKIIYKERTLYQSNDLIYPFFKNSQEFNSDLGMYLRDDNIGKKFQFDLFVIIDKNNRDPKFYIENSTMSVKQEEQVRSFLDKNKMVFFNSFGEDMLTVFPMKFNFNELRTADFRKFYTESDKLRELYLQNNFGELIKRINLLQSQDFFKNSGYGKLNNVMLGVAYLAQNNIGDACKAFSKEGDIRNLLVRNYLLNFCQKKKTKIYETT